MTDISNNPGQIPRYYDSSRNPFLGISQELTHTELVTAASYHNQSDLAANNASLGGETQISGSNLAEHIGAIAVEQTRSPNDTRLTWREQLTLARIDRERERRDIQQDGVDNLTKVIKEHRKLVRALRERSPVVPQESEPIVLLDEPVSDVDSNQSTKPMSRIKSFFQL